MMQRTIWESAVPKWDLARKPIDDRTTHKCDFCGKEIAAGDWALITTDNRLLICAPLEKL